MTDQGLRPDRSRAEWFAALLLMSATLLAWAPVAEHYLLVADDYDVRARFDGGLGGYVQTAMTHHGAWRFLGFLPVAWGLWYPDFTGVFILLSHLVTVWLFYLVCRRLLGGRRLPLGLALVYGVMPLASGALLWTCTINLIWMQALFFGVQLMFLRWGDSRKRQFPLLIATAIATLLAQSVQENLLLAFPFIGTLLWLRPSSPTLLPPGSESRLATVRRLMRERYAVWGPMIGVGVFLVIYRLCLPATPPKESRLWLRGLISPWIHQPRSLLAFEPWLDAQTRALLFWHWNWPSVVVAALGVVGLAVVLFIAVRRCSGQAASMTPGDGGDTPQSRRPGWEVLLYLAVLAAGAGAIYAISGGYSYDTRKRYALLPFLFLAAGWLFRRLNFSLHDRANAALAVAVIIVGVPTAWLHVGAWRYQSLVYNRLCEALVADKVAGNIRLVCDADLRRAWPRVDELNLRMDDTVPINNMLSIVGAGPIVVVEDMAAPAYRCKADTLQWVREP